IDALLLTHAHIDHSGYIPRLVRLGFRGPIYCTQATADLCALLLPDSGHLQEEDARYANKRHFTRHKPAKPLYSEKEAQNALKQLRPIDWGQVFTVGSFEVTFHPAGHILGASMVRISDGRGTALFSGDLGRPNDVLMPAPRPIKVAPDWLILESTYGDRQHELGHPLQDLEEVISRTVARGGIVVIPAFAVGRAQAVLWGLHQLKKQGKLPADLPVFMNSPMATNTTELYLKHIDQHRLSASETRAMCGGATFVRTAEESRALNHLKKPAVIISASGMLTGGRVLHHLRAFAPNPKNTVVLVGYQAAGTRGAALVRGAKEIKVHGHYVPIRCEIANVDSWSAHADYVEMLDWLAHWPAAPRHVFLTHGEPNASDALRQRIADRLGWSVSVPTMGEEVSLVGSRASASKPPIASSEGWRHLDKLSRVRALTESKAYLRADEDLDFLATDAMRPFRLALEFQKVEEELERAKIDAWVVVVGGSRVLEDAPAYRSARRFANLVSTRPFDGLGQPVICTGGGPGIMEAANRGAFDAAAASVGLNIDLPNEQEPNAYISPHLCFRFRYFALRKMHFLLRCRALVAFRGGIGTLDELFVALTLVDTQVVKPFPIVLVDRDFWKRVFAGPFLVEAGLVESRHLELVTLVDTAEEAWQAINSAGSGSSS
ncbi:MAG TPA: MBL fold metallo-hydrolase, partial [Nannocystis exedens]|nr:MBL fold metallo-hydrolase [Nannocystis exedens]